MVTISQLAWHAGTLRRSLRYKLHCSSCNRFVWRLLQDMTTDDRALLRLLGCVSLPRRLSDGGRDSAPELAEGGVSLIPPQGWIY